MAETRARKSSKMMSKTPYVHLEPGNFDPELAVCFVLGGPFGPEPCVLQLEPGHPQGVRHVLLVPPSPP